jgi:hypothetical protein
MQVRAGVVPAHVESGSEGIGEGALNSGHQYFKHLLFVGVFGFSEVSTGMGRLATAFRIFNFR